MQRPDKSYQVKNTQNQSKIKASLVCLSTLAGFDELVACFALYGTPRNLILP